MLPTSVKHFLSFVMYDHNVPVGVYSYLYKRRKSVNTNKYFKHKHILRLIEYS